MSREAHILTDGKGSKRIHKFLDELLEERNLRVLDRSGLQNSRRWTIVQKPPEPGFPESTGKRSALLIDFVIEEEWIDLEIITEEEGLRQYDIPTRMLEILERHPSANKEARIWREKCAESRKNALEQRKLMREIRRIQAATGGMVPIVMADHPAFFQKEGRQPGGEFYILDEPQNPVTEAPPRRFMMKLKRLNVERTWQAIEKAGLT